MACCWLPCCAIVAICACSRCSACIFAAASYWASAACSAAAWAASWAAVWAWPPAALVAKVWCCTAAILGVDGATGAGAAGATGAGSNIRISPRVSCSPSSLTACSGSWCCFIVPCTCTCAIGTSRVSWLLKAFLLKPGADSSTVEPGASIGASTGACSDLAFSAISSNTMDVLAVAFPRPSSLAFSTAAAAAKTTSNLPRGIAQLL
mmetsp:Transcript_39071/g.93754  ORF Transcript_39071/g.93754 Transcript_39071/m.93754 type:complete len:207 (-) Transcript_39071:23-643(-)